MDNTLPPTAPVINNQPTPLKKSPNGTLLILLGAIVIALVLGGLYVVTNKGQNKLQSGTLFQDSQKVAKIGTETIYGNDVNFTIDFFFKSLKNDKNSDELKKMAFEKIQADSILIQEDQKTSKDQLSGSVFDNPKKDQMTRQRLVQELQKKYESKEQLFSGEQLSLWYYNVRPPKIPEKDAQQLALKKITSIYNDLTANKITFKEAKTRIVNDSELAKIDFNYKGNAHFSFEQVTRSNPLFTFKELNDTLFSLNAGETSQIINVSNKTGTYKEEFYAILKVNKVENSQAQTYKEWLNEKKKQYQIAYL